ncbi:conserved hypothetical protein [Neospora caninum Liverpool]|uniref:Uncharacterized protein n=1 Tax=Neospora caninum (strain Liverpool) TaxID=572307 RepID=F0VGJ6_NEOCL|nr:conserved hypothetical protein [Neospora caninum Liverpool]CBZ52840.1 conserved hypothetical protein [Neospora caninum Liverpool]|eukprot:XP_003882872.1 conserved hypothetical protein [Neospora caninum Liverpool]
MASTASGRAAAAAASAALAAAPGSWGSRSRLVSLMARGICLLTGFGFSYSFANPDDDTVYEMFPLETQNKFAVVSFYRVEKEKMNEFEDRAKDCCRFNQQQQGYLFTRLLRAKYPEEAPYQYLQITTWLRIEDFLLARDRPIGEKLRRALPLLSPAHPLLYQNVADDTKYTPAAANAIPQS